MAANKWTKKDLIKLHKLHYEEEKSLSRLAKVFKKSEDAIRRKLGRMDWDAFFADPDAYSSLVGSSKKWTHDDMVKLDAFLQAKQDYSFIASQLGRTIMSVESKAQGTDWKAWRAIKEDVDVLDPEELADEEAEEALKDQLVTACLELCRHDFKRLKSLNETEFLTKVNFDKAKLPVSYAEIKKLADEELHRLGFGNDSEQEWGEGTYIIVGDSHGKFCKNKTFGLLNQVVDYIKPDRIVHMGHILDDDNDISYNWGKFNNLTVLAKIEELRIVQEQRHKFDFNYDIVRETIYMGDLVVANQDMISDYVKTPLSALDQEIFEDMAVVNCHRQEFFSRCSNDGPSYYASPGALCDRHIVKTIKQIDFEEGKIVKEAKTYAFQKYRRMRHMYQYWDQGFIVVQVDAEGNHTLIQCIIQQTSRGLATSYFDKIITSTGIYDPTKKIFVNCDMHSPNYDCSALAVQNEVVKDYKPDVLVNLGDTHNYTALNHWDMDRGQVIDGNILREGSQTNWILKLMSTWAQEKYIIYGNHERFPNDFVAKNPQFGKYLDFGFLCDVENLGYDLIGLKEVLTIGSVKFVHGEMKMFGQSGSKMEKTSRTFSSKEGWHVFMGHVHYPGLRFKCYSIGLSGALNQSYNEPEASTWIHGFGLCNMFGGKAWPFTICITNNQCMIGGKTYTDKDKLNWVSPDFEARVVYTHNDN